MTDDVDALLLELANARREKYDKLSRYQDFRSVFLGSEVGRRVLGEIAVLAKMNQAAAKVGRYDTNRTMFVNGEQSLAIKIMMIIQTEPAERPEQATTKGDA